MQTETLISARDVIAAIRTAFRSRDAGACHCQTVAKLGEDQLVEHFIEREVIQPEEVYGPAAITLDMIRDFKDEDCTFWGLRQEGIRYLIEVTEYSYKELCRLPSMGPAKADQVG